MERSTRAADLSQGARVSREGPTEPPPTFPVAGQSWTKLEERPLRQFSPGGRPSSNQVWRKIAQVPGTSTEVGHSPDAAIEAASHGSGAPAPARLSHAVEHITGADLSGVQIHTGSASHQAASALSARAYTVGQDIHFGAGEFQPGSSGGDHLVAHELAHAAQQGAAGSTFQAKLSISHPQDAAERQADQVADAALRVMSGRTAPAIEASPVGADTVHRVSKAGDVRDQLTAPDGNTTAKALLAFSVLKSLNDVDFNDTMAALSEDEIGKILKNVVSDLKLTDNYARMLMFAARWAVYDVPSLFAWLGTQASATQQAKLEFLAAQTSLSAVLGKMGGAQRLTLSQMVTGFPMGRNMGVGLRGVVKTIVNTVDDVPLLKACMKMRFEIVGFVVTVDGYENTDWSTGGLRKCYEAMDTLPDAHVAGLATLKMLGRYKVKGLLPRGAEGWQGGDGEIGIGYSDWRLEADNSASTREGDPLRDVNRMTETVRHEVGHAVDAQHNFSTAYCATDDGGGWKEHVDMTDLALEMVNATNGAIKTSPYKVLLCGTLENAMKDRKPDEIKARIKTDITALFVDPKHPTNQEKADLLALQNDGLVAAIVKAMKDPWYGDTANGGDAIGGRIYQESYANKWTSYKVASRTAIGGGVSPYQWRAPGEWFAEAYAAYYEPTPVKGAKLNARDPATKTNLFDAQVDTVANTRA